MCFLLQCKCPEAPFHRCSSEMLFSKKAWGYYYLYAKTQQIYGVISIKLHSKISSINLHFWECRLVWIVLRLKS